MYAFLIAAIIFGGIGFFNPGTLIIQPLPSLSANYINKDLPVNAILYSTVEKSRIKKIIPPAHNPKTDFSFKSVPIHQEPTKYSQPNSDYLVTLASEKETIAGIDNDALQKKNNLSGYVIVTNAPREFSIQDENSSAPLLAEVSVEPSPYVPSSSFSYHYFEDTTLPKRYVPTVNELRAQENLVIALKALEDIDWKNVDNLIQGTTKKDLVWLVVELNKSLSESDWEKITSQEILRTGNNIPENTLKQKQRFLVQLQKFHKDQLTQKQMLEEKKRAILLERVLQNQELQKCEVRKQKEAIKERKIVVI